ncbi:unnamed protein product [Kluyveromyces dobzhanskii CBS 2104]|uniref:WGS project CCBQ000000000 data, contig 00015 n=1 Tax=Kluyveromyces dobzhanskii CBS 2104 TaxID=1427455 RepID=A0A0A8L9C3_9SACH|nr:unnamed protein product [Kluyveromyces dobzhanskii CBS 2104]
MSSRIDTNEYDTEDEESMLQQSVDENLYSEIMKSLGINYGISGERPKFIDRDLLLQLVELKKVEAGKEMQRLKSENLNKLDAILAKINTLNLPSEVILTLIESSPGQLESNLERIGIMPLVPANGQLSSPKQLQSWPQVTPPQTQMQPNQVLHGQLPPQVPNQFTSQQSLPQPSPQAPPQFVASYHSRTISQPVEMMTTAPNPIQQQHLPPPILQPGGQQQFGPLPSLGGPQINYNFPPAPIPSDTSPKLSASNNRTGFYYPQRYQRPANYGSQNIPPPIYEQLGPLPNSRMGHKRSYSAMTVPEMSTFTIRRSEPNEALNVDGSRKSAKVSFLINTPKNPPK